MPNNAASLQVMGSCLHYIIDSSSIVLNQPIFTTKCLNQLKASILNEFAINTETFYEHTAFI